ncbi:MAG: 30S ribosomal protein S6 [Chloroflexota bacterium]
MRRYELMLVIRPDAADDRAQAVIDRATRTIAGAGGQIVKVSPWGRRRLAYPSMACARALSHRPVRCPGRGRRGDGARPPNITEEVMRHMVVKIERPAASRRSDRDDDSDDVAPPRTSPSRRARSSTSPRARPLRPPSTDHPAIPPLARRPEPCRSTSA